MLNEAVDQAVGAKDSTLLVQIKQQTQNKSLIAAIDQALTQLGYQ
jgi:hypothetical protein